MRQQNIIMDRDESQVFPEHCEFPLDYQYWAFQFPIQAGLQSSRLEGSQAEAPGEEDEFQLKSAKKTWKEHVAKELLLFMTILGTLHESTLSMQ